MNKIKTWTKADDNKVEKVIEFGSGTRVSIPITKDGAVKWFDDSRLIKKGRSDAHTDRFTFVLNRCHWCSLQG